LVLFFSYSLLSLFHLFNQEPQGRVIGSYLWMAPEVMKALPYTKQGDVYSFGMVIWEVLAGTQPWTYAQTVYAIQTAVLAGERPQVDEQWPQCLVDLMKQCW